MSDRRAEIRVETMTGARGRDMRSVVAQLAASSNDTPYDLVTVIDEKCFGRGAWGEPQLVVARNERATTGFAVISANYIRLLVVARNARRRGVGSMLLARCEEEIRRSGGNRVAIAGEPGNYFVPGILEDDETTLSFFERRGYRRGEIAQNLEAELITQTFEPPAGVALERPSATTEAEITAFIQSEFGRLWAFEVSPAFADPAPPLFVARAEGKVIGFSAHDVNNRGLGFYGPAGVSANWRGGGIGAVLLRASLNDLLARGYRRVIIPWVSSVAFYGKIARALPTHRFVGCSKEL